MANSVDVSRRTVLVAAVAASALMFPAAAEAGNIPPKSVKYQEEPNAGHQCSGCKLFIPGASADAKGTCKSVSGEINPNGWCVLFAAKEG